MKTALSEVFFI